MKKYTLDDVTKEELIEYFFNPITGGFRPLGNDKEKLFMWVSNKRAGNLLDALDETITVSEKALNEYVDYVRQANNEKDIDKKLALFDKANKAYERYEKYNKKHDAIDKKLMKEFDL